MMQDGQINPITGIFWQKNYDGLRDQQEVVITPNNPFGAEVSPEELQKKYMDAIVVDDLPESTERKLLEDQK